MSKRSVLLCLALALLALPLAGVRAQQNITTLTLAVPDFQREIFNNGLLKAFEDAHPGVKVRVVPGVMSVTPAANDISKHLDQLKKYVAMGDLVYVDSDILSPEAVNAGYFLDLNPLLRSDKNLNEADFYPAAWKAFQWENGFWALPTGASPLILTYDPEAFDRAGLPYPSEKWTLADLLDAAQKLTVRDSSGKVTTPGIEFFPGLSGRALLGALLGSGGLVDTSVIPNAPHFLTPEAEALLNTWSDLDAKGVIGTELGKAPISVGPTFTLGMNININGQAQKARKGTLLPGNKAGLDVQGFALSAGSQYVSLAYELAVYLTTRKEASGVFGGTSARKTTVETPPQPGQGNMIVVGGPPQTPDTKALNDQAIANGIGLADLRYTDYLVAAFQKMKAGKVDAHNALAELETLAVKNQKTALAQKGNTVITVATAPPPVAAGKITLNFGLTSFMRPIPFETEWQKLLDDFAASDPVVGKVNLQTDFGDLAQVANKNDCFYLPYNGIPGANLKNILNLDPYLSVDKTFDAADLVGNVSEQVQRDGKTWALPINLDPTLLKYHTELFKNAGIPTPKGTWTAAEFTDALKQLKNSAKGEPFQPNSPGGSYLLMLIAAYGGLPIDYRTDPPTVNLTAPANVDAIRQVLDLAKNGYIKYETIGNVGAVLMMRNDDSNPAPITSAGVGGMRFIRGEENGQDPYQAVLYPSGTAYRPMSYGLGTAYISAKSQNPDACYRLISQIARHPELFSSMPARRSIINSPNSALSKENVALYNQIDALLKDKNTITFPSMFQGGQSQAGFLIEHWVFEVFDNYVQKGANLESGLAQAEQYIKGFQECIAQLPALDATNSTSAAENMKAYLDCGVKVDPRLKDFATGVR